MKGGNDMWRLVVKGKDAAEIRPMDAKRVTRNQKTD